MASSEQPQGRRRRIDRVTAPDYLDGLEDRSVAEIREMRDDCRSEETRLSYARRVVQGQLDIARAGALPTGGSEADEAALVAALARALADEPAPASREARSAPVFVPEEGGYGNRAYDTLVDDPELARLGSLDDAERASLMERLVTKEAEVSRLRRAVLDHLDALQAELIRRYREGPVDVDELVASATRDEGSAGA